MHILWYNTTYFGWKLYYLESISICNLTAIEFPVSCTVFLKRFVNISMLISEKPNHKFAGNHCFSNHKIVNFVIFYQMLFIRIRNVSQDWNAFLPFESTVMVVPVQKLTMCITKLELIFSLWYRSTEYSVLEGTDKDHWVQCLGECPVWDQTCS